MKRHRLLALAAAVTAASAAHAESTLEERLAAAEDRLAAIESQGNESDRVEIKGFMTFAMARTDAEDAAGNDVDYEPSVGNGIPNQEWSLTHYSRAGVQIDAKISDRAQAVVQLLGRARDDYDAKVQWAYVAYDFTPTLSGRAGRLVLPFYLHSQYSNVGYAYNWVALPSEMYSVVPLDTFEGVDLTWSVNTGPVAHSLNVFWGGMDVEDEATFVTYQVRDQHGANLRSSWNNFSSWLSYSASKTTLNLGELDPSLTPLGMNRDYASFAAVGLQYDNGSLIASAETTRLKLSTPNNWFPALSSAYVSAGYRIGKWTPVVTWAQVEAENEVNPYVVTVPFPAPPPATIDVDLATPLWEQNATQQRSWTFGARYDLTPGIAIKGEVSSYYGFKSDNPANNGLFSGRPDDEAYVYRFSVDTVF